MLALGASLGGMGRNDTDNVVLKMNNPAPSLTPIYPLNTRV
jgi:hypothetical protein